MEQPNQPIEIIRQCLTRFATDRGLSLVDAEDIVQETLLNYFESRRRWYEEDVDPQPSLLWTILRRRLVDHIHHEVAENQATTLYTERCPKACPDTWIVILVLGGLAGTSAIRSVEATETWNRTRKIGTY